MAGDRLADEAITLPFGVPDDWGASPLGAGCEFVRDGDWIETKDQGGSDYRLLQISNIGVGRFVETGNFRWISEQTFSRLNCTEILPGDVLVARMPEPTGRAWHVAELSWRAVTAVDVAIIRAKRDTLDPRFLAYFLNSPACLGIVHSLTTGTTRLRIRRADIERLEVPLPSLPEQRAIAHILGTLDDKIELNRRMNETLEAMARALFKSWFVDFDPVRAKAEGRDPGLPQPLADLFPDSFEDSELGEIPKGWRVGRFGDVVEQLRDQENPLSSPEALYHHFSLPAFDEGQSPKAEYGESIKSQKSRVPAGVVLLSKLNPEIERVWLVDVRPTERAVCSTEFLVLRARSPFTRSFIYCLARSPLFRQQIEGLVTGTSKSHQRAQVDSILNLAVVAPPLPIVAAFDRSADSLLARTLECRRGSRILAGVRDTLLPKLVTGELRVNVPEKH